MWHLDVEKLLVLKNNKGVEENRVRHMDYGVQLNKLMYQRLVQKGNITLFSPNDVPGLYDAFFADQAEFERLYLAAEQDDSIRKQSVSAIDLFSSLAQERSGTGRIYIQNVDHCNTHSSFIPELAPVRQSNLCLEITLPTKPLQHVDDPEGEISLCTLAAFNVGIIELSEYPDLAKLIVEALDNLLTYQDYPIKAAKLSTMARRPLGIGVINFAYALAKRGFYYGDLGAYGYTHKLFEHIQHALLTASCELAKEKGACPKFNETKYSRGLMPIDHCVDLDIPNFKPSLELDWDSLRADIVKYGLRNSTLTALMPSETSSQISNATNGIEPPRGYVSVKSSKDGVYKQVVPELKELKNNYQLLWSMPNNEGYLNVVAIANKFIDQAISANTNYDPSKFPGGKVTVTQILKDLLYAYKKGVKTLYYHNTRDGSGEQEPEDDGCAGGACKI